LAKPKLLCDENFDPAVMLGLRRAGFDVIHIYDVDRQGASDEEQLLFAIQENRAILTKDRVDFEELHRTYMLNGWEHCGIVACMPYDTRTMIRELINLLEDKPEVMSNGLWYV
jgi:predicted nuclease of predicted toxin-antitoxin system